MNIKYSDTDCIVTSLSFCLLHFDLGLIGLSDKVDVLCIPVFYYIVLVGFFMCVQKKRKQRLADHLNF